MRLTAKIMIVLLATVVLFTSVASYFSIRSAYEQFRADQQELARDFGRELHQQVTRAWRQDGLAGVIRMLDQFAAARSRGVSVRWVWFESATASAQMPHGRPADWNAVQAGQVVSVVSQDARGRRQLYTYLPLRTGSGRLGGLEITNSLAEVERHARQTAWRALITIGGLALVCIGITYLAGIHWVALPLEALIEKTKRIGEGDFSRPLVLRGKDELAQLAVAVNRMCDRLSDQQDRIAAESSQRSAAVEQLRHADRLKTVGRLAAGLAHELGTPLNVVAGRAALIATGKLSESETESSARTIKSEADRIIEIVRQLLDFARQRPPRRVTMDLRELVQRTLDLLRPLAAKKQIELQFAPVVQLVTVDVDEGQFQQVLTNIVMNAIQVTESPDNVSVELSVAERPSPSKQTPPEQAGNGRTQRWARIAVTDHGPGIPQDVLQHIFEPFFTTKDVGEGTGLGLSIAYSIVQEHDGWIAVESQPDKGTTFDVYIPQENRQ